MAETHNISDRGKAKGLLWYASQGGEDDVFEYVSELASYARGDWTALVVNLRDAYPDKSNKNKFTVQDLHELAKAQSARPLADISELSRYKRSFERIARWLERRGKATSLELAKEFVRGLPRDLKSRLVAQAGAKGKTADGGGVESEDWHEPSYQDLYEEVRTLLEDDDN
ncbi:hypothetical protein JCM10213v2_008629 [Rhodosporidiobolus nylandii]